MTNRSYYRTHTDYLRARIEVLRLYVETDIDTPYSEHCKKLLTKARRELEKA